MRAFDADVGVLQNAITASVPAAALLQLQCTEHSLLYKP